MELPERIYAERDRETSEGRWYSTKGMGAEYVRAEAWTRLTGCFETLQQAIQRQGYEVLTNIDGTKISIRRRER